MTLSRRSTSTGTAVPQKRALLRTLVYSNNVDMFAGGGGSTEAAVTLDTVADESRKNVADGVAKVPVSGW